MANGPPGGGRIAVATRVEAEARPILLEPIVHMKITAPESTMGDIAGDLPSRRGLVSGTYNGVAGTVRVRGQAPMSELSGYQSRLNSMTSGQGRYTVALSHHQAGPPAVQREVMSTWWGHHDEDRPQRPRAVRPGDGWRTAAARPAFPAEEIPAALPWQAAPQRFPQVARGLRRAKTITGVERGVARRKLSRRRVPVNTERRCKAGATFPGPQEATGLPQDLSARSQLHLECPWTPSRRPGCGSSSSFPSSSPCSSTSSSCASRVRTPFP
jgi:hypothetical protein